VTDDKTKEVFSANVKRVLQEQGHSVHWLQLETGEYPNRIYPAVRGDAMPSAGLLHRIATALHVTVDSLLLDPNSVPVEASKQKPKPKSKARSLTSAT